MLQDISRTNSLFWVVNQHFLEKEERGGLRKMSRATAKPEGECDTYLKKIHSLFINILGMGCKVVGGPARESGFVFPQACNTWPVGFSGGSKNPKNHWQNYFKMYRENSLLIKLLKPKLHNCTWKSWIVDQFQNHPGIKAALMPSPQKCNQ